MSTNSPYRHILEVYESEGRLRRLPQDEAEFTAVDLSSNDYLGLGAQSDVLAEEFLDSRQAHLFSSSASRLLSHHQAAHLSLEKYLSALYDKSVLLFNSGYHANCGAISALAIPGSVILADRLAHASMIDGIILSRTQFERFRHNNISHLRRLLEKHSDASVQIVVTESIFSMDGDEAPLEELVALKKDFPNMLLYVDEAHGFGVRGARGLGVAEEKNLIRDIDIIIGTFGKAAASTGAFIATSPVLSDFLLNSARSFIFSTALPPINMAFTHFIINKIVDMEEQRRHLSALSEYFRERLSLAAGCSINSTTQIVPWIIGDPVKAVEISRRLHNAGFDALAIRRPTVPPGGDRIRFSLNAAINISEINPLFDLITTLRQ